MTRLFNIFCEVPCLTERSIALKGIELQRKWFKTADKRILGQYLQKFIEYNSNMFSFLGVKPMVYGVDQKIYLAFKTSEFVGTIPLRAPDTGKQIGDFVVSPRYSTFDRYEEYIEILDLLGDEIKHESKDSLPLISGNNFRPPIYLEAIKFITKLETLIAKPWRKFDNIEKRSSEPLGQISWRKFIESEFKVENRMRYPVRKNILTELHPEYQEIKYVFDISKRELLSSQTPHKIKNSILSRIDFIEQKLYNLPPKNTRQIKIRSSDTVAITECKIQANRILKFKLIDSVAWRVDFSEVFERFIQFLFKEVAKITGGRVYANARFHSKSISKFAWELKHIEPDAIYQQENLQIFIDAKYKSNLYNKYDFSDVLKEQHRHDLHQIMAYSSFSETKSKVGFLCYPSTKVESKSIRYLNPTNGITSTIYVLGVPLKKDSIKDVKIKLIQHINEIARFVR